MDDEDMLDTVHQAMGSRVTGNDHFGTEYMGPILDKLTSGQKLSPSEVEQLRQFREEGTEPKDPIAQRLMDPSTSTAYRRALNQAGIK